MEMKKVQRYFLNILCWIDCGLDVPFGADYRETCSSRLGRYYGKVRIATVLADAINWVALHVFGQKNHCQVSIQPDNDHEHEVIS